MNQLDTRPEVIVAARTKDAILCDDYFMELGCHVHVAPDDGSGGMKAYASQRLEGLTPGPPARGAVAGRRTSRATSA